MTTCPISGLLSFVTRHAGPDTLMAAISFPDAHRRANAAKTSRSFLVVNRVAPRPYHLSSALSAVAVVIVFAVIGLSPERRRMFIDLKILKLGKHGFAHCSTPARLPTVQTVRTLCCDSTPSR